MSTELDSKPQKYTNIKIVNKDDSRVDITGEMPAESLGEHRKRAITELGLTLNVPGFRKGHIPEKVIVDRVGDMNVLEEAAEMALRDIVPEIIEKTRRIISAVPISPSLNWPPVILSNLKSA